MYIVIQTQHLENKLAPEWDGTGECPQRWAGKGGDTYIVEGVTLAQSQDAEYWKRLESLVTSRDEWFQEYILDMNLIDDVDFESTNYHDEWCAPRYLDLEAGTKTIIKDSKSLHGFRKECVGHKLVIDLATDETLVNEWTMEDGSVLSYQECCEWLAKKDAERQADMQEFRKSIGYA